MPRYQYRYTDAHERVLHGLSHDSASVERDGQLVEARGTVVARPGDLITTRRAYKHPFMERVGGKPDDNQPSDNAPDGATTITEE